MIYFFLFHAQNIYASFGMEPSLQRNGSQEEVVSEGIVRIGMCKSQLSKYCLPANRIGTGKAVVIFPAGVLTVF